MYWKGSRLYFKDNPNLITIFICAPMDKCIKREMELLSFDAKRLNST